MSAILHVSIDEKSTKHNTIGSLYGVNGPCVRLCVVIQHGLYDASNQHMGVIYSNAHILCLVLNSVAVSKLFLFK